MASLNKVCLLGNVGRDPEVRSMNNGGKVVNLSVATSETWKDKNSGERQEKTEWHRVVIFNDKIGEVAEKYVKKGSRIYIEGSLQTRKWTDQSGAEKYSTEVVLQKFRGELVLLGEKGAGRSDDADDYQPEPQPQGAPPRKAAPIDDSIPFAPCM